VTIDVYDLEGTELDAFTVYSEFTKDIPSLLNKHFPEKGSA